MPVDILDLSEKIPTADGKLPRVLILEDSKEFGQLLKRFISLMKCEATVAETYESAVEALVLSEEIGEPFSIATIDRRFVVGEGNNAVEILQGTTFLRYIKVEFPYIACLMISGESITPSQTLDLRDYFSLDYYLSKDKISPVEVAKGILRAVEHCKAVNNQDRNYSTNTFRTVNTESPLSKTDTKISSRQLREILVTYFNEEEIKDICFDMNQDYENLGGIGKTGKARELIGVSRRQGRFIELVETCRRLRPHAF